MVLPGRNSCSGNQLGRSEHSVSRESRQEPDIQVGDKWKRVASVYMGQGCSALEWTWELITWGMLVTSPCLRFSPCNTETGIIPNLWGCKRTGWVNDWERVYHLLHSASVAGLAPDCAQLLVYENLGHREDRAHFCHLVTLDLGPIA